MTKAHRILAVLSLVTLGACGGATDTVQPGGGTSTEVTKPETEVTNPVTGLKVKAAIASAALGDGSANVQLAFVATEATAPASISVTKVLLLDGVTGDTVDTLEASDPSVWNGSSYETWNEKVTPGGDLRASYKLTTPEWSTIDQSAKRTSSSSSYSRAFKLRMTLLIDGAEVTIDSGELQREPQVAT